MTASQLASCAAAENARPARRPLSPTANAARLDFIATSALPIHYYLQPAALTRSLNFDHHILTLDRNRKCLGPKQRFLDQRRALLHFQIEGANLGARWIAP